MRMPQHLLIQSFEHRLAWAIDCQQKQRKKLKELKPKNLPISMMSKIWQIGPLKATFILKGNRLCQRLIVKAPHKTKRAGASGC